MKEWSKQLFAGVYVASAFRATDARGAFVKTFASETLSSLGIEFTLKEEFYSISHLNVIRGMHFQLPPHDHNKIVYVSHGAILDVLVDLRKGEPTYRMNMSMELSSQNGHVLWIPKGIAHGFKSLANDTCVVYKTDFGYVPSSDCGVRWDSIGFSWGPEESIISERDRAFPTLTEFESPF